VNADQRVLLGVKRRIHERGWTQKEMRHPLSGAVCLMGASGGGPLQHRVAALLAPVIVEQWPREMGSYLGGGRKPAARYICMYFNDNVADGLTDIDLLLDKAIAKAGG
jgi:hypothetical protein